MIQFDDSAYFFKKWVGWVFSHHLGIFPLKKQLTGCLQETAFVKAVERLGLDLNPAKLFSILRGPSSKAGLGRELPTMIKVYIYIYSIYRFFIAKSPFSSSENRFFPVCVMSTFRRSGQGVSLLELDPETWSGHPCEQNGKWKWEELSQKKETYSCVAIEAWSLWLSRVQLMDNGHLGGGFKHF